MTKRSRPLAARAGASPKTRPGAIADATRRPGNLVRRKISLSDLIASLPLDEQIAIEREAQREVAKIRARQRKKSASKRSKRVKS